MPGGAGPGVDAYRVAAAQEAERKKKEQDRLNKARQAAAERLTKQAEAIKAADIAKFERLKKNSTIKFNPPVCSFASGSPSYVTHRYTTFVGKTDSTGYVPNNGPSLRDNLVYGGPKGRDTIFSASSQVQRKTLKGSLIPDLTFATDWTTTASAEDTLQFDIKEASSILNLDYKGKFNIFGFRFQYNPASLDFGLSSSNNVNIGYIAAGKNTAMPTGLSTDGGGSISLMIPLTRVDDLQIIRKTTETGKAYVGQFLQDIEKTVYTVPDLLQMYGSVAGDRVTEEDLQGIYTRGTGYDLEFLFRACLGKQWMTKFRGRTADVGLLFGVPLILTLGKSEGTEGGLRYRVRLSGINFTHKSFTPNMVPMYTELALSFDRIPDVTGY